MAKRTTTEIPEIEIILNFSREKFTNDLTDRIDAGNVLLKSELADVHSFDKQYKMWNDYNKEYLGQAFTVESNKYKKEYEAAGYHAFGQAREVGNNPILSTKNLIEDKVHALENLINRSGLFQTKAPNSPARESKTLSNSEVFIVHGHDEAAKVKTARFVEQLGLKPIILHEQNNSGMTIIEKIEKYSDVGYALVLYTPCDVGATRDNQGSMRPRARQNVVFEHGYLIGKIGRNRVSALVKGDIETPNDISGVVYTKLDDEDAWHYKIAKELRNVGYEIDLNRL